ncbi:MAG: phosphate signaling complex protein PhoU [Candidatus Eisenbacteria bacterium]|nr:phosphate signaling complex protein PhoU [Candidatus Eisenbacteria bacterium]
MPVHLQNEITKLKRMILALSGVVEENVRKAVSSIERRDAAIAGEVIKADLEIDQMEVDVEEECLKALALHQPVAVDLRFIVAVLKINNDLERIDDLAVNIAKRALFICRHPAVQAPFEFGEMCRKTLNMLRYCLDGLMKMDDERARLVRAMDDEVDDINRHAYQKVFAAMRENPDNAEVLFSYLSASRHLERIADYATNISEDIIYMINGKIVRHGADEAEDRAGKS